MSDTISSTLAPKGLHLYERSLRTFGDGMSLFVARGSEGKFVGLVNGDPGLGMESATHLGQSTTVFPLTWANYQRLSRLVQISPSPCDKKGSFGTGDRLGMVTAAHLDSLTRCPVFPVIAQQSPRELERTDRDFKDVLLKAVMGVLETGYTGGFGADADHIKDETRFLEGVEAGFSMYTLDVSDDLRDISKLSPAEIDSEFAKLSETSRAVVQELAGKSLSVPGGADYVFDELELRKSALIYEKSMEQVVRFNSIAKSKLTGFDLEVSIDEGGRDTTPEDHIYVAEFLHRKGVSFTSLAPRFPGEFQKAVDYIGDYGVVARSFAVHAELARQQQGYRLSLHSGSDKFSVYKLFSDATQGSFHIKTSGTSWLQAVKLVAHSDADLFKDLYSLCVEALPESKKAYHVYITPEHFPSELPRDLPGFHANPDVQQLFHISYGALLAARRGEITKCLLADEARHYEFVTGHINKHLDLLFGA